VKKKSKTIYKEEVMYSDLLVDTGQLWVFAPWQPLVGKKHWNRAPDMPTIICSWWRDDNLMAICHQSLQ